MPISPTSFDEEIEVWQDIGSRCWRLSESAAWNVFSHLTRAFHAKASAIDDITLTHDVAVWRSAADIWSNLPNLQPSPPISSEIQDNLEKAQALLRILEVDVQSIQ
jgi:hypothetical protein